MPGCIFCKIIRGEMPCVKIYEDEQVLSFLDINPINPGHALVVPKKHYGTLFDIPTEELEACIAVAQRVGRAVHQGMGAQGLNLLQNNFKAAGQLIEHAHFHLIPRFERDGFLTSWPMNPMAAAQMQETLERIQSKL